MSKELFNDVDEVRDFLNDVYNASYGMNKDWIFQNILNMGYVKKPDLEKAKAIWDSFPDAICQTYDRKTFVALLQYKDELEKENEKQSKENKRLRTILKFNDVNY